MDSGDRLSRRHLLERASLILAAAGAPALRMRAEPRAQARSGKGASGVMAMLSTYMSEAAGRELPADALEKTKHHLVDTLAAMVSGVELPPGQVALKFARAHGSEETATV